MGIVAKDSAAPLLIPGLWSLQHRGKESAGIVTYEPTGYHARRGMGTVDAVFGAKSLDDLGGAVGIGHVRYSTTGASSSANIQPIEGEFRGEPFWIAHNGNLTKFDGLTGELRTRGDVFKTDTDTEVIAALIHFSNEDNFEAALKAALKQVTGTYALTVLHEDKVFGVRDPTGNRPLIIGRNNEAMLLASETATCDVLGMRFLREVEPGEMVVLDH